MAKLTLLFVCLVALLLAAVQTKAAEKAEMTEFGAFVWAFV